MILSTKLKYASLLISCLLILILHGNAAAQWKNNPEKNKVLAANSQNPLNLCTASDKLGGAFVIWEDDVKKNGSSIYMQHVTSDGILNFGEEGRKISPAAGIFKYPVAAPLNNDEVLILFKQFAQSRQTALLLQKIGAGGFSDWGELPKVVAADMETTDPEIAADTVGNIFVAYINKENTTPSSYNVLLQKFTSEGVPRFKEAGLAVNKSPKAKSHITLVPDNKGGAIIFWMESADGYIRIFGERVDAEGRDLWGRRPLLVTPANKNVINYNILATKTGQIYVYWETKAREREVFHQMISMGGKVQWQKEGVKITSLFGENSSPRAVLSDSTIFVAWVNDLNDDKDVYVQKFDLNSNQQWKREGLPVIKTQGQQLSCQLIHDGQGGIVVSWLDKRQQWPKGNICAQRFDMYGNRSWDSLGVVIASDNTIEKSYLSLIASRQDAAIAVFKGRNGHQSIYAEKIPGSGRFASSFTELTASQQEDLIKIVWKTAGARGIKGFFLERSDDVNKLHRVKFIDARSDNNNQTYEYSEVPPFTGTIYYRLAEVDSQNNINVTEPVQVNYFSAPQGTFSLGQNSPNPFSEKTAIKYYLPYRCDVVLEVFNDKVEIIEQLVTGQQEAGAYEVVFDVTKNGTIPENGVYFYRLKAGDFVDVKKMILAR